MQSYFDNPGVDIRKLKNGTKLLVKTRHNTYNFNKIVNNSFEAQGGKYLPEFKQVVLNGSTFGGSMIKLGYISLGMNMEIYINDELTITTSKVQKIRIEGRNWHYDL